MGTKASVYTKTGDDGTTGLVDGSRIKKSDPKIDLYGEVDELNSCLGLSCSFLIEENFNNLILSDLYKIQKELFDLGSNLACVESKREKFNLPKLTNENISFLESKMDEMDSSLEPLRAFILPGGSKLASSLHICRTVCRRLERKMCAFSDLPPYSRSYINRLSDYFFILSRYVNDLAQNEEILWKAD